jgi:hypothetical protein
MGGGVRKAHEYAEEDVVGEEGGAVVAERAEGHAGERQHAGDPTDDDERVNPMTVVRLAARSFSKGRSARRAMRRPAPIRSS